MTASAALSLVDDLIAADLKKWRDAGYAAIDRMIISHSSKNEGHEDREKIIGMLERESTGFKKLYLEICCISWQKKS